MNRRDLLKAAAGAVAGAAVVPLVAAMPAAEVAAIKSEVYTGPRLWSLLTDRAEASQVINPDGSVSWTIVSRPTTIWIDDRGHCVCIEDGDTTARQQLPLNG